MAGKEKKKRWVLKDMKIDEISLVGVGANEGALQAIYKADNSIVTDEDMAKRMFNEVMSEMGVSEQVEEFMETLLNSNRALGQSLIEIVKNPEYADKKESMRQSIGQFVDTINGMINQTDIIKQAPKKTEDGKQFPASDYAYVPDSEKPSTWKLRLTSTPGGGPDARIVGAAVAALGPGFRGQKVQIPSKDLGAVKAKVRAAWKKANPDREDLPTILKEVVEMDKELEFYKTLAGLDAREQAFFKSMSDPDKEKLFEKELEDRVAYIKEQAVPKNDETIEVEGLSVKKSVVGSGAFEILKAQQARIDAAEKVAKEERKIRIQKELEDRAAKELPHLTGTIQQKAELLKVIDGLPDDQREGQLGMLKAADAAMAKAFKEIGQGGTPPEGDANTQLKNMAKTYATANNVTFAKAYSVILESEEGRKLYAKTVK